MSELDRYLFLAGALPYVFLGLAHARATPQDPDETKGLSPRDAGLRRAMGEDVVFLTRRTTVWLAWVGFNLSHSLGAVLFGTAVLLVGRNPVVFRAEAPVFLPFAVLVGAAYLGLGIRYWFRTPIVGLLLAESCFVLSWVLWVFGD